MITPEMRHHLSAAPASQVIGVIAITLGTVIWWLRQRSQHWTTPEAPGSSPKHLEATLITEQSNESPKIEEEFSRIRNVVTANPSLIALTVEKPPLSPGELNRRRVAEALKRRELLSPPLQSTDGLVCERQSSCFLHGWTLCPISRGILSKSCNLYHPKVDTPAPTPPRSTARAASPWVYKPIHVGEHWRTTKRGKRIRVRSHRRRS